jgi:hypothetical protein
MKKTAITIRSKIFEFNELKLGEMEEGKMN